MKNILRKILIIISIFIALFSSFWFYYQKDFSVFLANNIDIRSQKLALPDKKMIDIMSLGHSLSYADFMWLSLIQYIGTNISNNNFTEHSFEVLEKITEISPKFSIGYEWALLLLPVPKEQKLEFSENEKQFAQKPLNIAKKWLNELCDMKKIELISQIPVWQLNTFLENSQYKNACKSGTLPYFIAFYGGQLMGDTKTAELFYKVAALHDDAPVASMILASITSQPKDNPKTIAENFFLMALNAYDENAQICQNYALEALQALKENSLTVQKIQNFSTIEKSLKTQNKTFEMQSCQWLAERGTKYLYLYFFNEQSKKYPNIDTIDELLEKIGLNFLPNTQSQNNMSLRKNGENWEFYPLQ